MGLITKPKNWADNENVLFTDLNSDFDTLYNEFNGNIDNSNIKSGAAIDPAKIANTAVDLSTTQTISGQKTMTALVASNPTLQLYDGWVDNVSDTWVFVTASSFKIVGINRTNVFTPGTKIKWKEGSTQKYGHVLSSVFGADTTVNIIVNTDHVLTNTTLSNNAYSYDVNPQGFPRYFNYAVTWTGITPGNAVQGGRYHVEGTLIFVEIFLNAGSTTTFSGNFTASLPVVANPANGTTKYIGSAYGQDGGSVTQGYSFINGAASVVNLEEFNTGVGQTAWNTTTPFAWSINSIFSITAMYGF